MAINTNTFETTLQGKLDNVTDPKEMLLLGKALESTVGSIAVSDIQTEGTTQTNAVNTAGTTKVGEVNSAGSTQVTAVNNAGTTQVAAVNTAGASYFPSQTGQAGKFLTTDGTNRSWTEVSIPDLGDLELIPSATDISITNNGQSVEKTSGTDSWNRQFYSKQGFPGSAYVKWTCQTGSQYLMVGLTTDPTTNDSYDSIDFAWFNYASAKIYENGADQGDHGTYTSSTVFEIIYSGTTVKYYMDGVLKRTQNTTAGQVMYVDASFRNVGNKINNLSFGAVPQVEDGKVLQVHTHSTIDEVAYNGAQYVTHMDTTVTPVGINSKFILLLDLKWGVRSDNTEKFQIVANSSNVSNSYANVATQSGYFESYGGGHLGNASFWSFTANETYTHTGSSSFSVRLYYAPQGSGNAYLNRATQYRDLARGAGKSTWTILEVSQ